MGKDKVIPKNIGETPEKVSKRIQAIPYGTPFEEVMRSLKITSQTPGVRRVELRKEKQEIVYGSVTITGSPEEIEQFKQKFDRHTVVEILFSILNYGLRIDSLFSVVNVETGPDLKIYLIFYDQLLSEVSIDQRHVTKEQRIYLSSLLGGIFRGGVSQGVKKIP